MSLRTQLTVAISAGIVPGNWLVGLPGISHPFQAVFILQLKVLCV